MEIFLICIQIGARTTCTKRTTSLGNDCTKRTASFNL